MEESISPKVFICHSHKDRATADAICKHLEFAGINCWIAPRNLKPGTNWTKGIMQGLEACRVFVLVFTEAANDSDHVEREVAKAFSAGLAVIPFRIGDVLPNQSLSYFLDTVQWLDATEHPAERRLGELTNRVHALLAGEHDAVILPLGAAREASFYHELRSRQIYRIAGGYILGAWTALRVAAILTPTLDLPIWTMKVVTGLLLAGFSGALYTGFRLDARTAQIRQKPGRLHFILWPAIILFLLGGIILGLAVWTSPGLPDKTNTTAARSLISEKSIAVLPFDSLSENKSDGYFADGVQDEILNSLAKIAQLKVISRTSVMHYRTETKRDLRQIADTLAVANVLEGTVRRNGNRVRVSAELINALNDTTIWADSYDRDLTDIFAIQSEVAQTIATKLTATLSPEERKSIQAKPTENLEAYDLYLRAKKLILVAKVAVTSASIDQPMKNALALLEQSVLIDPKFTLAYCAAAEAHDFLYLTSDQTPERRALGDTAVNNALTLQPDLPEAHLAKARHLYHCYRDYDQARQQLAIAKRGLPNDSEATFLQALMDRRQGQFEKAIQEFNEAVGHDPRNPVLLHELAVTLHGMRQYEAESEALDRTIELQPDQPMIKLEKAAYAGFMKTGDDSAFWSTLAALPPSAAEDAAVLSIRLDFALHDRDWVQAEELIKKLAPGGDALHFAYGGRPVPVKSYSILLSRLRGEKPGLNSEFIGVREQLRARVLKAPQDARLISQLAVVDALLNHKETAISEARQAVEMLPISKDALFGVYIEKNLAAVYTWTDERDQAFAILSSLAKTPFGFHYGSLKCEPYWEPLRQDPRFQKLLDQLRPSAVSAP
ncbi:MAG: TIR domain-containing protein [Verrucomicrobia bacterium]|nr:TIR domain-containing protein [Verrucomicrobiota bacterium]